MESPPERPSSKKPPALTVMVESWLTPVVGLLALVIGLVGGYFLRPLVAPQNPPEPTSVAAVPATAQANQSAPTQSEVPEPIPSEAVQPIVEMTRHFLGSEDAPITIIEFSDFQ